MTPRQETPKNIPRPPPTDATIAFASYKKNSSDVISKSEEKATYVIQQSSVLFSPKIKIKNSSGRNDLGFLKRVKNFKF